MDARLRSAVDASVGWYEDLCALHGVGSMLADGLWSALEPPPPLHSDAVVVEPGVTADQVAARLAGRAQCGVKDSFATMDLSGEGMRLLFEATWIHREVAADRGLSVPVRAEATNERGPVAPVREEATNERVQEGAADRERGLPGGWVTVSRAEELAAWTGRHDTTGVLLPPLLRRAHFRILARYAGGEIVAGAVARLGSGAVDVSNVYAVAGHGVDWAELATVVGEIFPGRPLVGYERGDALAAAIDGGFAPLGELRVWVR